jgi:hypothetical protein
LKVDGLCQARRLNAGAILVEVSRGRFLVKAELPPVLGEFIKPKMSIDML